MHQQAQRLIDLVLSGILHVWFTWTISLSVVAHSEYTWTIWLLSLFVCIKLDSSCILRSVFLLQERGQLPWPCCVRVWSEWWSCKNWKGSWLAHSQVSAGGTAISWISWIPKEVHWTLCCYCQVPPSSHRKTHKLCCTKECQASFENLRHLLTSA